MPCSRSHAKSRLPAVVRGGAPGTPPASRGGVITATARATPGTSMVRGRNGWATVPHSARVAVGLGVLRVAVAVAVGDGDGAGCTAAVTLGPGAPRGGGEPSRPISHRAATTTTTTATAAPATHVRASDERVVMHQGRQPG